MPDLPVLVLLALLLSLLIYGLLRVLFPASGSSYHSGQDFESLHERFRYAGFRQFAVMAALTLVGSLIAYGVYQGAAYLFYSGSLSKSIYLIRPNRFARLLVALLGGSALGLALSPAVFKRLLGANYEDYVEYQNHLTGLNNELCARSLSIFLVLAYAVVSVFFLHWYSAFGPVGMRQAQLLSTKIQEHEYSEIVHIEERSSFERPDGKRYPQEHFLVFFRDGKQWSSRNSGYDDDVRNRELLQFLREKIAENQ